MSKTTWSCDQNRTNQLMRLWYMLLPHRRPAKAQARSLARAFAVRTHELWNIRRVRPKIRHLAPLDDCACVFEEWSNGQKVPKSHELAQFIVSKYIKVFTDDIIHYLTCHLYCKCCNKVIHLISLSFHLIIFYLSYYAHIGEAWGRTKTPNSSFHPLHTVQPLCA